MSACKCPGDHSRPVRDPYREGYKAAARYYANQHAVTANVAREWAKPSAEKVRGLIRKHWPALAEQIDRLEADQ